MELNNDLITQFAKITKFNTTKSATTVRGTIRKSDDESDTRTYLQIDGAEEGSKTPVETVVEVADGDRVIATVKDHSVIVTGNKSNPSIGVKTRDGLRSEIKQEADRITSTVENQVSGLKTSYEQTATSFKSEVNSTVEGLKSSYEQTAELINQRIDNLDVVDSEEFTEFRQTVEGFYFTDEGGTVWIDGGSVYAKNLNLTGAITWNDLNEADIRSELNTSASNAANTAVNNATSEMVNASNEAKAQASAAASSASKAETAATNAAKDAEEAKDYAKEARDAAESFGLPDYIQTTYIDKTTIESPTIVGGTFYAVGSNPKNNSTFSTMDENGFYLYSNSVVADADNAIYPKISMLCSDTINENPMLILGAGESDEDLYHNRFIIEKTSTYAWLEYHFDYSYPGCGITFHRNGNLYIKGTLAGETGLFPIGYIYLSYDDTISPASLFGGSWTRLNGYFLYAGGPTATMGDTGSVVTAGGTNSATYIKIAAWRRTK